MKSNREFDDSRLGPAVINFQPSNGDRQLEPATAGAPGIEVKDAVFFFDLRFVRVTRNDDIVPGRVDGELFQIVQNVKSKPADLNIANFRNFELPRISIVVASDRDDRCDLLEFRKDFGFTYVAGVQYQFDAFQSFNGFRPQKPVRVRDDADQFCRMAARQKNTSVLRFEKSCSFTTFRILRAIFSPPLSDGSISFA